MQVYLWKPLSQNALLNLVTKFDLAQFIEHPVYLQLIIICVTRHYFQFFSFIDTRYTFSFTIYHDQPVEIVLTKNIAGFRQKNILQRQHFGNGEYWRM